MCETKWEEKVKCVRVVGSMYVMYISPASLCGVVRKWVQAVVRVDDVRRKDNACVLWGGQRKQAFGQLPCRPALYLQYWPKE